MIKIVTIYCCREVVTKFGLWDQIRVDCGREWYLTLYINETVAHLRNDTNKVSKMIESHH